VQCNRPSSVAQVRPGLARTATPGPRTQASLVIGCSEAPQSFYVWRRVRRCRRPLSCRHRCGRRPHQSRVHRRRATARGRVLRSATRNGLPVLRGLAHAHRRVARCLGTLPSTEIFRRADKGHTCERSRNPNGTLSGADASTASDAAHWSPADVERRMDFALRCAYAHGTQAVRTHLMSGSRAQFELAWCVGGCASVSGCQLIAEAVFSARRPAFLALRERWRGRIVLQGVALVVLSYFRCASRRWCCLFCNSPFSADQGRGCWRSASGCGGRCRWRARRGGFVQRPRRLG
jgi:hypothetical protein